MNIYKIMNFSLQRCEVKKIGSKQQNEEFSFVTRRRHNSWWRRWRGGWGSRKRCHSPNWFFRSRSWSYKFAGFNAFQWQQRQLKIFLNVFGCWLFWLVFFTVHFSSKFWYLIQIFAKSIRGFYYNIMN